MIGRPWSQGYEVVPFGQLPSFINFADMSVLYEWLEMAWAKQSVLKLQVKGRSHKLKNLYIFQVLWENVSSNYKEAFIVQVFCWNQENLDIQKVVFCLAF